MNDKVNWKSVLTYYFISCLWSWPFFWLRDIKPEIWRSLPIHDFLKTSLIMWGPGISAIICFIIFKSHRRLTTLKGTNLTYGFISYFVLSLSFALWTQKLIFLLLAPLGFFNTLGEELGWRGFLQDSLKNMSDINKAIIVGILWELWHFTNRTAGKDFSEALLSVSVFGVGAILISYFMLKLSNRTCSLTIAVTVHAAINSSVEFPMGWQAVLSCVPIWCFLIWKWDEKNISLRSS